MNPTLGVKGVPIKPLAVFLGALSAVLVTSGVVTGCTVSYQCTPVSQSRLDITEEFVRTHLPQAYDIESGVRDCDDDGEGYVNFSVDLTVQETRKAFLKNPACSLDDEDPRDPGVACKTDTGLVYVFFTPDSTRSTTQGEIGVR
jgi:hypothetical protein